MQTYQGHPAMPRGGLHQAFWSPSWCQLISTGSGWGLKDFPGEGQDPGDSPSLSPSVSLSVCLTLLPRIQTPFIFWRIIPYGILGESGLHLKGLQSSLDSMSYPGFFHSIPLMLKFAIARLYCMKPEPRLNWDP